MFQVFICHAASDASAASAIAARLDRGTGIRAVLHDIGAVPGQTVVDVFDSGLSSGAILLLLSPDAVPPKKTRQEWQPVLDHVEHTQAPPVGKVRVRDCEFPQLLARSSFFRWDQDPAQALREIEAWLLSLGGGRSNAGFEPAVLARFTGRDTELDLLWTSLVDNSGAVALVNPVPGSGKTALAQHFAQRAQDHFRGTVWVDCADRAPEFITGCLAHQLGARVEDFGGEAFVHLGEIARQHRLLVVMDDVRDTGVLAAAPEGHCSVIVTTQSSTLEVPAHVQTLAIDPHESAQPLTSPSGEELRLLEAMSVCRPGSLPLALATEIAGITPQQASAACGALIARGWVDPLDAAGRLFRLPAHSQSAVPGDTVLRRKHAEVLWAVFRQGDKCRLEFAPELEPALQWAFAHDWSIAIHLAKHAFNFYKEERRICEAAIVYRRLRAAAFERGDSAIAEQCDWELSWIEDSRGAIKSVAAPVEQLGFDFA